ncbi:MAG: threonylcarbamoyl-AMP synthase [Chloroflexi bacterium]|nr:threonylcarbamoyl-AMP synthase [Chloroflexota bacterium]
MTRIVRDDDAGRAVALEALRRGEVVALPTDTVYGVAVDLHAPGAIDRLFAAKGRPAEKAIILLLADAEQAADVGVFTPAARLLAEIGWPGGLTLVLRQRSDASLPPELTGGAPTIGLRVPDHPAPRALAAAVGPLPTTSANLAGRPAAETAPAILQQLGEAVAIILDGGPARGPLASTVVDCSGERPRILRAGVLDLARLAGALDEAGLAHDIDRAR